MNYGKICVILLAVIPAVFSDTDYCDANLCEKGIKHIACDNDGVFNRYCASPQLINMTSDYRKLITSKHNLLRNKIARGFKKFPPAQRMATMIWDDELAKLAEFNIKQCEMRHDECRNTPRFSFVGQNVGSTSWKETTFNETEIIENQIREWFKNFKHCPLHVLTSYKPSNVYSRFTTMIQDKSSHLGCAILKRKSCRYTEQIMVCNYSYDNMLGVPVYNDGPTASQCTTGTNSIFRSLCSLDEKFNLKHI